MRPQSFSAGLTLGIAFILSSCAGSKDFTSAREQRDLFESFFGFAPPEILRGIEGRRVWVGDTLSDWICVPCNSTLFDRIVAATGAARFDQVQLQERWKYDLPDLDAANPNAPPWWPTGLRTVQALYFERRPYAADRAQADELYFWRDSQKGVVFAHYVSWR